jgi:hypothetical protein
MDATAPTTNVATMGPALAAPTGAVAEASGATRPAAAAQDAIALASADAPPKVTGPLALPSLAAGADASPAAEVPPPPYGTVYKFDAEGRILPTPEGIMTPEGVLLVAGKPKQLPPDRPAELSVLSTPAAPEATATAATPALPTPALTAPALTAPALTAPGAIASGATAAAAPEATAPAVTPAAAPPPAALAQDPTLKGKRPKDRPADLPSPADKEGALSQSAPAAPVADSRLAGFRPQPRPAALAKPSPIASDTGADTTAASASLAASGAALLTSPKPQARPSGLDDAVNSAVQVALSQPTPAPKAQAATTNVSANVAPEPLDEPDLESPAPNLPTNASVAKQATVKRGLNTSQVALLAVFGTPSTRFAMIRQANGAVKRVKVGDSMDGGRIAAITDTSVQYQRGGRIVTLSLPSG